jgi:hypothetical protein
MTDRMKKMVDGSLPDGTLIRACEGTFDYLEKQADRIEKLEAALREMLTKCTWENNGRWCGSIDCHCRIARKALEGKDDT